MEDEHLYNVLKEFLNDRKRTSDWVARHAGLSRYTLRNWVRGGVENPRYWQDVVKVASALDLTESEATRFLTAAGHLSIPELLSSLPESDPDRDLLDPWAPGLRQSLQRAPFQAISDIPHFVGRRALLNELKAALLRPYHQTIYSLEGMGGTGKTVLAAHLAYELRPGLPGGVLWARVDTADPMSVLAAFAAGYEEDVSQYRDIESRSQVVRDILAERRALMVLDNVQSDSQIKYLLPPTGSCAVLITTRNPELWATRTARRFNLGPFDKNKRESLQLFTRVLGPDRALRERAYLRKIAELLGHLPLAVDVVAGRIRVDVWRPTSEFLTSLQDEHERLNLLAYGEENVRLSFSLSFDALPSTLKGFFASLGSFGGEDFSPEAVAYITELTFEDTSQYLENLRGLSLIQHGRPERYTLHPLLRDYAREKSTDNEPAKRLVAFFVTYIKVHCREFPKLDLEFGNILAALETAQTEGLNGLLIEGINLLFEFLETRGLYEIASHYLNLAVQAARSLGDNSGMARTLYHLGKATAVRGAYDEAESFYNESLRLAQSLDAKETIVLVYRALGKLSLHHGNYQETEKYYQEALSLARQTQNLDQASGVLLDLGVLNVLRGGYPQAEAFFREALDAIDVGAHPDRAISALGNLGWLLSTRGDYAQAETYFGDSLAIAERIGHREAICRIKGQLGWIAFKRWDIGKAEEFLLESLAIAREIGHEELVGSVLTNLALIMLHRGEYIRADSYLQEGIKVAAFLRDRRLESIIRGHLGVIDANQGNFVEAENQLRHALKLAQDIEYQEHVGYLLMRLGNLKIILGQYEEGEKHLSESLSIARKIEHRENIGDALLGIGKSLTEQDEYEQAQECFQESLRLADELQHRELLTRIGIERGQCYLKQEHWLLATDSFRKSEQIAREITAPEQIASSLRGLAQASYAQGNIALTRQYGKESLALYEALNHYAREEVSQWLRTLSLIED